MSNGIGRVWAVNAEGGDEGRPNGVGPVWIENADQLGSKLPEPESGDAGKVLGVLNSDGDIGWVPDQEGMAQVQADWDQVDSSQVSYIANKPNLATVATSGSYTDLSNTPTIPTVDQEYNSASANAQSGVAVAGAISGKQDTINDLETIRSGAAAGATAVQPATLNDYATTSALTSGLSTKQDTINDLETIRSGASAGATAVQPSSLATVATTGSYDDLLDKPTIPPGVVVDQVYDSASTNAQSGTAVAGAISGVRQVPSTSSGDNGKVLGVTDSAGTLGWVAKGEADLFYVTYNVTTFDEIKTAYDAGKWPVLIDSHGHVSPMTDYGWIGTASSLQYAIFQNNSYAPYADTTGADYENEVYILELEIDPDMHRTETWSTTWNFSSADWNASSGPRAIRNKPTIPTVDQSYNAASTNAQSGTAVAQAIAAIPSASYTAGDAIDITAGEISVKAGTGLEISDVSSPVTENLSCSEFATDSDGTWTLCVAPLTQDILNAINTTDGFSFTTSRDFAAWGVDVYVGLYRYGSDSFTAISHVLFGTALTPVSDQIPSGTTFTLKASEVDATYSTATLSYVAENLSQYRIGILNHAQSTPWSQLFVGASEVTEIPTPSSVVTATYSETTTIQDALCVSNPLPASSVGDANKVLTVNNSGAAVWATPATVTVDQTYNSASTNAQSGTAVAQAIAAIPSAPTYTAGDGIRIASNTISANFDPKGLKITSGKIDINLATNSGLSYDQSTTSETLTVGGSTYYNGSIRLYNSGLSTYLDSASAADTFTLTIPGSVFGMGDIMPSYSRVWFAFSNTALSQYPSNYAYIDVTDQLTLVEVDGETQIGACSITLPAYMYASAGWSADVASHLYGFFITDEEMSFYGAGNVTASYSSAPSGLKVSNPIQLVNALPATPDANTLYLIPEA